MNEPYLFWDDTGIEPPSPIDQTIAKSRRASDENMNPHGVKTKVKRHKTPSQELQDRNTEHECIDLERFESDLLAEPECFVLEEMLFRETVDTLDALLVDVNDELQLLRTSEYASDITVSTNERTANVNEIQERPEEIMFDDFMELEINGLL